jgi:hypothetical protein
VGEGVKVSDGIGDGVAVSTTDCVTGTVTIGEAGIAWQAARKIQSAA